MTLWIGLHLHSLSLDTWRLRWLTEPSAAAVFEHDALIAMTSGAQQCGLKLGMRCATVRSLAPECLLYPRDQRAEQNALDQAAQVALAYSPSVYQHTRDTLLIDVTYSLRLFGGVRLIVHELRQQLKRLTLQVQSGVAPTATGAWLLAQVARHPTQRFTQHFTQQSTQPSTQPSTQFSTQKSTQYLTPYSPRYACSQATLERLLNPLPCAMLPSAQPHLVWLKAIGCETLRGLRALPRSGLQRRVGTALLTELEHAYTQAVWRQAPYLAPEQFIEQLDLLDRLEHTTALVSFAERLALSLCTWLAAKQFALRSATLELHHERGRHACPPTALELAFGEPVWLMSQLMPLLHERLSRQSLAGPVVALTLRSQALASQHARSATLFPDPLHASADYRRLLDLLSARLGAEQILQPAPLADHRPEIANNWVPFDASTFRSAASTTTKSAVSTKTKSAASTVTKSAVSTTNKSAASAMSTQAASVTTTPTTRDIVSSTPAPLTERPFWLLAEPLLLNVRHDRPIYHGPLQLLRGPERIESGWWDHLRIARDYFVAQDQQAVRYWIYRERDTELARWFLHGVFG
jgi:protein ImuB